MTLMGRNVLVGGAACAVAVLAGCVQQPEPPPDRFYRLTITPEAAERTAPVVKGTLEVERPVAEGLTAGTPMVYLTGDDTSALMEYQFYYWEKEPALMIRDALIACMENGRMATNVVSERDRVDADYSLISRIGRFERIEGEPPQALLELRVTVRDNKRARRVFAETYSIPVEIAEPAGAADAASQGAPDKAEETAVEATVVAFNEAMAQACRRLSHDLANNLSAR